MSRKSSRSQWTAHLSRKAGTKVRSQIESQGQETRLPGQGNAFRGVVLGIDPSLRGSGFAVLAIPGQGNRPGSLLHSRILRLKPSLSLADCLGNIAGTVGELLARYPIDHVALEQTIYVQNFQTAQILGAARGAAIAAAALEKKPVFEYAPLRIKQAVVGFGRASKEQVAKTVEQLLGMPPLDSLDETDAVGVALCHALTWRGEIYSA